MAESKRSNKDKTKTKESEANSNHVDTPKDICFYQACGNLKNNKTTTLMIKRRYQAVEVRIDENATVKWT